jgi:hypothetical protein
MTSVLRFSAQPQELPTVNTFKNLSHQFDTSVLHLVSRKLFSRNTFGCLPFGPPEFRLELKVAVHRQARPFVEMLARTPSHGRLNMLCGFAK